MTAISIPGRIWSGMKMTEDQFWWLWLRAFIEAIMREADCGQIRRGTGERCIPASEF